MNINQQEYQSLLNSVNDMVFVFDFRGRHQAVNNNAVSRLDYSREELLSMNQDELHMQQHVDRVGAKLQKIQEKQHVSFESEYETKWGKTIPVKILASVFKHHEEPAILSIVRDLTETSLIDIEDVLELLKEDLKRVSNLSKDPLDLQPNEYDLIDTIEKALRRYQGKIIRKGIIVIKNFPKPLKTSYDEDRIIYVFWNLFNTAIRYTQERMWISGNKEGEKIQVSIRNKGSPYKWEDISNISTVKQIIKAHNGTFRKEKTSKQENLITLTLPVHS